MIYLIILCFQITLIPVVDDMDIFKSGPEGERMLQEFQRYGCGSVFTTLSRPQMPEVCRKMYRTIAFLSYNGAIACKCNEMGSQSTICEPDGGGCTCRPNVIMRTCDRCAPYHFGFGPEGCKQCDCHPTGSLDSSCDVVTGQCKCSPNTYGRRCSECQPGFWGYPFCKRCDCNGHAEICDSDTGAW